MIPKIFAHGSGSSKNRIYYMMGLKHEHKVKAEKCTYITSNCIAALNHNDINYKGRSATADEVYNEIDTATKLREMEFGTRRKVNPDFHMALSLSKGEKLTREQWTYCTEYMLQGLGFDLITNKYYSEKHEDTKHEHIHISANRIKLEPGYPIVSDSNDRVLACKLARDLEIKFKLTFAAQPHVTWGTNISQKDAYGAEKDGTVPNKLRLLGIVAGSVAHVAKEKGDMIDLVRALRKKDVYVHLTYDKKGQPKGISYQLGTSGDANTVFAGSQLKGTRLTFGKLITQEGIRYDKARLPQLQAEIEKRHRGYVERPVRVSTKPFRAVRGYYYYVLTPRSSKFNIIRLKIKKPASQVRAEIAYEEAMKLVEAIILLFKLLFGIAVDVKQGKAGRGYTTYYPDEPVERFLGKQLPRYNEFTLKKLMEQHRAMEALGLTDSAKDPEV